VVCPGKGTESKRERGGEHDLHWLGLAFEWFVFYRMQVGWYCSQMALCLMFGLRLRICHSFQAA